MHRTNRPPTTVVAVLLVLVVIGPPVEAASETAAGSQSVGESYAPLIRSIEDEINRTIQANPNLFPASALDDPEEKARVASAPVTSYEGAVSRLAIAHMRVELEMVDGTGLVGIPTDDFVGWLRNLSAEARTAGQDALMQLEEVGLAADRLALEDGLERYLPATLLAYVQYKIVERVANDVRRDPVSPYNISGHLPFLENVVTNMLLLERPPPTHDDGGPRLTVEQVTEIRTRLSYDIDTFDVNMRVPEVISRRMLEEGNASIALLSAVQAEMVHHSIAVRKAQSAGELDLRQLLTRELALWEEAGRSPLLMHGLELGRITLEVTPEEETIGGNNAGILAANALARLAAVRLVRGGDAAPSLEGAVVADQGGLPAVPLLGGGIVLAAAAVLFLRRSHP